MMKEETVYGLVGTHDGSERVGQTVVHDGGALDMDEALFLLLDLREERAYTDCHISTAISYPYVQVLLGPLHVCGI